MALAAARDAGGQAMGRPTGVAPPAGVMSIYAAVKELITKELITKDPWRGKRQGRDDPRAQESGARVYGSPSGVSPQAAYSGEARVPKSIIQEGKKGIRGLMIVFMEIQPVTGFSGEI
jgi:hypothetical protein